jgi:hypothetical protein
MASPINQTNGIGGTSGGELVTLSPLHTSGDVWYVSSSTGSDAASPRGKERSRPLATLAQAFTNAAANDTIVLLAGHSQTIATGVIPLAGQTIVGEGSGSSRPTLTFSGAGGSFFLINAAGVWIDNLILNNTGAGSVMIDARAAGLRVTSTQFNCDSATSAGLYIQSVGGTNLFCGDCTFTSSGTSFATQGAVGLLAAAAVSDVRLENVVFDGGTYGWSDYAFRTTAAISRLCGVNVDLLNDSDTFFASGTTGLYHVRNKSGSARVVWTA